MGGDDFGGGLWVLVVINSVIFIAFVAELLPEQPTIRLSGPMAPLRDQMDGGQQQPGRSGHNAEPLDNGIADVDDPVAFQRLCRRFSAAHIQRNLMLRLRKTASIFHCADLRSELMPRMPAAGYGSDDRISWTPQVSASAVAPAFVPIPYPPYNALTVNSRSVHTIECFQPGSSP